MSTYEKAEEKDTFVENLEKLENWEPFGFVKYEIASITVAQSNLSKILIEYTD